MALIYTKVTWYQDNMSIPPLAFGVHTPAAGCDHLDDAALVAAFEALEIAPGDFRHREHVRAPRGAPGPSRSSIDDRPLLRRRCDHRVAARTRRVRAAWAAMTRKSDEVGRRTIERVQTGVRMEKRMLLLLKALAGALD